MSDTDKRIFVLLKVPDVKPEKVHLFTKDYQTDGSAKLIQDKLNYGLADFKKGQATIYEKDIPYAYWVYDPKSWFTDYWVVDELFADEKLFTAFRVWYEGVVIAWTNLNRFPYKKLVDKPGEYVTKFIITLPLNLATT